MKVNLVLISDSFLKLRLRYEIQIESQMCDVMRSLLVLFSSRAAALPGVLLPMTGPHTSHVTVHCHDITLSHRPK